MFDFERRRTAKQTNYYLVSASDMPNHGSGGGERHTQEEKDCSQHGHGCVVVVVGVVAVCGWAKEKGGERGGGEATTMYITLFLLFVFYPHTLGIHCLSWSARTFLSRRKLPLHVECPPRPPSLKPTVSTHHPSQSLQLVAHWYLLDPKLN